VYDVKANDDSVAIQTADERQPPAKHSKVLEIPKGKGEKDWDQMNLTKFKGLDNFSNWSINRKLRHQTGTPASAMKASRIGGSTSICSGPNVSI
jgi:hypothetical protein